MLPDGTQLPYEQGPPPELLQMLQQQPEEAPMGPSPAQGAPELEQLLASILSTARTYLDLEQDAEDRLLMEQATTLIERLRAKAQKERDGLLQGKISPGALR